MIGPGFTIGGGFGLQWTKNSEEATRDTSSLNLASEVIAGAGYPFKSVVASDGERAVTGLAGVEIYAALGLGLVL